MMKPSYIGNKKIEKFREYCKESVIDMHAGHYARVVFVFSNFFGDSFDTLCLTKDIRDLVDEYNKNSERPYKSHLQCRGALYKYQEWLRKTNSTCEHSSNGET